MLEPEEPRWVTCTPIPSRDDPRLGYSLVEIPATGTAPHMVDGAYRGRGDKTKRKLSDPEVRRLHAARANTQDLAAKLLDDYVARDPVKGDLAAHGFIVAAPLRPRTEMLLAAARTDGGWREFLKSLKADRGTPETVDYKPALAWASSFARRDDGASLGYNLTASREQEESDQSILEFEATEDGTVRVMTTALGGDPFDGRGQVVFEDVLPHLTHRTIGIAATVADVTGYGGSWALGVAATGIAGKPVNREGRARRSANPAFGKELVEYRGYTEASTVELRQTPARSHTALLAGSCAASDSRTTPASTHS